MRVEREEILRRLRANMAAGVPIIGTGAGTGISAKFEEVGGSDLIIIYNSGKYRMAGRGSASGLLAFGDANKIVMEMADEILPVVDHTPVLAGVNGSDPFKNMKRFLKEIKEVGFSGIQNFPSIGGFDGRIRAEFEQTGLGFEKEVEMVSMARELDLFTSPYAWDTEEAAAMAKAGADVLVAHVGCTVGGSIGMTSTHSLEDAVKIVQEIRDAAVEVNPDIIVLCHGGAIATPADAQYVMQNTTGISGYYGASSIERLPVERAIRQQVEDFKKIRF